MAKIILLHGLHMHAWAMRPFALLLEQHGFAVERFGYYSVFQSMDKHAEALADFVRTRSMADEPLHFVGHSLGGLVLRHFACAFPEILTGRTVTLGTPHQGSLAAERVRQAGLGAPVLGGSYRDALDGKLPEWPSEKDLGCIGGTRQHGLGRILFLTGEHDGTVLLEETRCKNMRDALALPVSHSGMLFDKTTAAQTAYFLKHGIFRREP